MDRQGNSAAAVEQPLVSVLVVNWNTREMTLAALESLLVQTPELAMEVIVVDNGSTDGSAEAIRARFPQVLLLAEPINHGFGAANNLAALHARGRYLLLLNSDTVVLDRAVERLVAFAQVRADAGIWGGRTVFADGSPNIGSAWGAFTPWAAFCFASGLTMLFPHSARFNPEGLGGWDRSTERQVDIVSGCFFLIARTLWERLGGFDPAFFMYGEEADLCFRARAIGARPRVTPGAVIVHHGEASTPNRYDARLRICAAKVVLAQRTMAPAAARWSRRLMIAGVGVRALLYGAGAALSARYRVSADVWGAIWRRRRDWAQRSSRA